MAEPIDQLAYKLLRHMGELRVHPGAGEAVQEITRAVHQAQRAIDRPADRIYGGPCPICGHDLLGKPGRSTILCRECDQVYDIAERQAAMRDALDDHLDTPSRLAHIITALGYPVTPELIRKWAQRGKLMQRPNGMYRAGDVIALAAVSQLRT